jgi:hypothetical protein
MLIQWYLHLIVFNVVVKQEAEEQNTKILDLRRHLRGITQEMHHMKESGEIKKSLPIFDTSTSIYADIASPSNKATTLKRSNSFNTLSTASNPATPRYMSSKKNQSAGSRSLQYNNDGFGGSVADESTSRMMQKSPSATSLNNPHRGPLSLKSPVNWLHQFREDVQRAIDDGRCRSITLKECKEMMDKIYESKSIANDKAQQGIGILPMETLEQHTFRTMEKKYGLRSLAVEHAGMLLQALEQFAPEDNDVSVFQKIFRNEIEEDFRLVQAELNKAIRDLTMVQIMGRNPTKDQPTLMALLEQKLSTGCIYEDEWTDMINYMYHESDRAALGLLLKRQAMFHLDHSPAISASTPPAQVLNTSYLGPHKITKGNSAFVVGVPSHMHHTNELHNSGVVGYDKSSLKDVKRLGYSSTTLKISVKDPNVKSKKEMLKLPYLEFIKIVLDFQLRSHQEYLAQCLKLFRQVDADVDGVLNAAEFREFFHNLKRSSEEERGFSPGVNLVQRQKQEEEELQIVFGLLKNLDPFETDRIVYSSAVSCLQKLQHTDQQFEVTTH